MADGPWVAILARDTDHGWDFDVELHDTEGAAKLYASGAWGTWKHRLYFRLSDAAAAPRMRDLLQFFADLIRDSRGVDGYHLNGDVAEWGEFEETEELVAMFPPLKESGDAE